MDDAVRYACKPGRETPWRLLGSGLCSCGLRRRYGRSSVLARTATSYLGPADQYWHFTVQCGYASGTRHASNVHRRRVLAIEHLSGAVRAKPDHDGGSCGSYYHGRPSIVVALCFCRDVGSLGRGGSRGGGSCGSSCERCASGPASGHGSPGHTLGDSRTTRSSHSLNGYYGSALAGRYTGDVGTDRLGGIQSQCGSTTRAQLGGDRG